MTNKDSVQSVASEFTGDEKKLINKISDDGNPSFTPREEFKNNLDYKIQEKIRLTQKQREDQATLDAVPRNLKWRFYLTGYGYAVCTFLVLFLIGFCTNIFTGTLKIPTKYTYLTENEAFGSLEKGGELAYNYSTDVVSNYVYYDDIDTDDFYEEEIEESAIESSSQISVQNEPKAKTLGMKMATNESAMMAADMSAGAGVKNLDIFLADEADYNTFAYNETYRFAYKDKLFPKLSSEYPVYKSNGVLMGSNTPNQVLKNLKIGNVSFKNFQDLDIMSLEMEQSIENGYNITFDNRNMKLYFYPNSSWEVSEYEGKLPSNKQILKNVERDLKNIGVSLKNYGEGIVDETDFDDSMGIIQVFYPLLIQGKSVRNAENDQQIGMRIAYDLSLQKVVSIIGMDIATYDISNYPTLDKESIKSDIEQGGEYYNQGALHEESTVVLFDSMEIVYTENLINGEIIYTPAIRSTVSTSMENYTGPLAVYEKII